MAPSLIPVLFKDLGYSFLLVGVYILIAVGAVMMFVGFLGCYGAIQESQCLLGTVSNKSCEQSANSSNHMMLNNNRKYIFEE